MLYLSNTHVSHVNKLVARVKRRSDIKYKEQACNQLETPGGAKSFLRGA